MNDNLSELYDCIDTRTRYIVYNIMKNMKKGNNFNYVLYGMIILIILMIINIINKIYYRNNVEKYFCYMNNRNEIKCNRF
jgi:ABC-type phosphate transport system permease subunit